MTDVARDADDERPDTIRAQAEAACARRQDAVTGHSSLWSSRPFRAGEVITPFRPASLHSTPAVWTVQVGEDRHIELWPTHLRYCNHSCEPNCFFDVDDFEFVALRDIAEGEELTFFYPSTEWQMEQPFTCHCGTTNCLGSIAGASALPLDVLESYRLSSYIAHRVHPA